MTARAEVRASAGRVALLCVVGLCVGSAWPEAAAAWGNSPLCALRTAASVGSRAVSIEFQAPPKVAFDCRSIGPGESVPWTRPITIAEGRDALRRARMLIDADRLEDALLQLRILAYATPALHDRVALMQAEVFMALGRAEQAAEQYGRALRSLDRSVAAQARVGHARALLAANRPDAETNLRELLQLYPDLPDQLQLRWEQAKYRERRNNRHGAAQLYRYIDLQFPWTELAADARGALRGLAQQRVWPRRYSPDELVARARRMVRMGDAEQGQVAVDRLLTHASAEVRAQGHLLQAKLARVEGRWDEMKKYAQRARSLGADEATVGRLLQPVRASEAARNRQVSRHARARISAIRGRTNKPVSRLNNRQLRLVLQLSLDGRLGDVADDVLAAMSKRRTLLAKLRFEAALRTIGVASDERVAELLRTTFPVRRFSAAARYHYARAMERLGRVGEAEAEYLRVRESDRSNTRYYAMWADQRLWALQNQRSQACVDPKLPLDLEGFEAATAQPRLMLPDTDFALTAQDVAAGDTEAILEQLNFHLDQERPRGQAGRLTAELPTEQGREPEVADRERVLRLMRPVVHAHGQDYPWLVRSLELVRLGEREAATDELNETYLAWRDARGGPRLRSGLDALYRGEAPPRRAGDLSLRRRRARLDEQARARLSQAAELLGDPGVSARFAGWQRVIERPRAYARRVQRAARKHGLDPNLLFAVMRVESIYNRRIVSTAGAVGLMQIMPRTGRLIAERLGREGFKTTDLLDPDTNIEFAAWYLASLLRRFDGHLPLAVASYNGGPHNVRAWMREHGDHMPLDVFLEHIPFSQTHRYVRRVLTHYAAYRAQQGLPMTPLSLELPAPRPDTVVTF